MKIDVHQLISTITLQGSYQPSIWTRTELLLFIIIEIYKAPIPIKALSANETKYYNNHEIKMSLTLI